MFCFSFKKCLVDFQNHNSILIGIQIDGNSNHHIILCIHVYQFHPKIYTVDRSVGIGTSLCVAMNYFSFYLKTLALVRGSFNLLILQ